MKASHRFLVLHFQIDHSMRRALDKKQSQNLNAPGPNKSSSRAASEKEVRVSFTFGACARACSPVSPTKFLSETLLCYTCIYIHAYTHTLRTTLRDSLVSDSPRPILRCSSSSSEKALRARFRNSQVYVYMYVYMLYTADNSADPMVTAVNIDEAKVHSALYPVTAGERRIFGNSCCRHCAHIFVIHSS